LHFNNIKIIPRPYNGICFWFNKDYYVFQNFITDLDNLYTQRINIKNKLNDIRIIYENDDVLIIQPNTFEASCKYGSDTRWCTSFRASPYKYKEFSTLPFQFFLFLPKKDRDKRMLIIRNFKDETKSYIIDINNNSMYPDAFISDLKELYNVPIYYVKKLQPYISS
jgi:hypothetical protein